MKRIFLFVISALLGTSISTAQTVSPFIFGDEYRIINNLAVNENKVAVVSTTVGGIWKPIHLEMLSGHLHQPPIRIMAY